MAEPSFAQQIAILNSTLRGIEVRLALGRPPVEGVSPASSTSPLASSASTRCATVERASPVCRARSARVTAVPARIRLSSSPAVFTRSSKPRLLDEDTRLRMRLNVTFA